MDLKEAYLKATGTGLAGGLGSMSFVFDEAREIVASSAPTIADAARWQFRQYEAGAEHVLGARGACRGAGDAIVLDGRRPRECRRPRDRSGQEERAQP